ncbi:uncharacterized protein [Eucyclogobius newberryi]
MASVPLQINAEHKILAREPNFSRSTSMPQTVPTQNASQPEVPWESVTLNRCLFIAITILVLTSGFQRLHEALHGHKVTLDEEDHYGLIIRRSGALRHRTEPEATLWEVILSWLPDLDDDDNDDDDDDEHEEARVRKRKPKRRRIVKTLGSLRNRPLPDKLLKKRESLSKVRQAKKLVGKNEDLGEKNKDNNKENVE